MSRPSIERLLRRYTHGVRAYVGTAEVAVDVLGDWRRRPVCSVREPIVADAGFGSVLHALASALSRAGAANGALRGLSCAVVLADAWVVYDVIPLDVTQVPADAADGVVASSVADIAGVRPGALDVRWQWQRDGRGAFAMGVSRDLLAQLRMLLAQHEMSVRSVTGEFVAVYNARRDRMSGARVVFAVVRDAGAQIALLSGGVIRATRFEMERAGAAGLLRAAAGVMRARGEDTTAQIEYLIDAGSPGTSDDREQMAAAGWSMLSPPPWASAH